MYRVKNKSEWQKFRTDLNPNLYQIPVLIIRMHLLQNGDVACKAEDTTYAWPPQCIDCIREIVRRYHDWLRHCTICKRTRCFYSTTRHQLFRDTLAKSHGFKLKTISLIPCMGNHHHDAATRWLCVLMENSFRYDLEQVITVWCGSYRENITITHSAVTFHTSGGSWRAVNGRWHATAVGGTFFNCKHSRDVMEMKPTALTSRGTGGCFVSSTIQGNREEYGRPWPIWLTDKLNQIAFL